MKNWWQSLSLHEQQFVLWGSIVATILLYFTLIWFPISHKIQSLKEKVIHDQEAANWMAQASNEIIKLRKLNLKPQQISKASLLSLIDDAAKASAWGAMVTEIKKMENDEVTASFKNIPFDELIRGLEELWNKENIQVDKISLQRSESANLINATVTFKR